MHTGHALSATNIPPKVLTQDQMKIRLTLLPIPETRIGGLIMYIPFHGSAFKGWTLAFFNTLLSASEILVVMIPCLYPPSCNSVNFSGSNFLSKWTCVIMTDNVQWLCVINNSAPYHRHIIDTSLNMLVNAT
ncbi:hypothetical protein M9H77_06856 [Catharanthus roseus]|uniref:Uncharacterized protein n=1 Tax=Catharanthus roseus TaxID=4058 RepID=A0ACC0BTD7_CATRO|nr:hypothetical protein M9H77_06856 [Catharanthus roseus]